MAKSKPNPDQVPFSFLVPESDWQPPAELPDLAGQRIALDLETRDDGIAAGRGSGWAVGAGYICGVSVAWEGGAVYAPVRHPDTTNCDREAVVSWLRQLLTNCSVVFQNGGYDIGWLQSDFGLEPPSRLDDTHAMAVMLDENRVSYRLDDLCRWQGIPGKDKTLLREAATALGVGDTMSTLWRLPARYVGPYAEGDARATLALADVLRPQLAAEGLQDAYQLEADLIPLCAEMRRKGIRVDTARAEKARASLRALRDEALAAVGTYHREGRDPTIEDVRSPRWLERAFTAAGVAYHRTPKNDQGSFQSDWLDTHAHPLPQAVSAARYYQMIEDKFIRGFILDYCHRGRLHAEINQLRDASVEGGSRGARSYRFSYSDPPLQQMPNPKNAPVGASKGVAARNRAAGLLIRSCFLPEEGERWCRADWSQQEYRLMVHFAARLNLTRADEAVARYAADPKTDYHLMVAEMTGLPRSEAKAANFAQSYGAGAEKFAEMSGRSVADAKRIQDQIQAEVPFIKELSRQCSSRASNRGYVRLLDGARCRFDTWEPGWGYEGRYYPPCPRNEAEARANPESHHDWAGVRLRRAFTHKAMNRLIQGSAARQCKAAMRALWREGLVPLLQLHDEVDFSYSDENVPIRVREIMETIVPLKVPMLAEVSTGPNWGEAD